jgi:hypothetical protein
MTMKIGLKGGRVLFVDDRVRAGEPDDTTLCKCCAASCESEVTVSCTFCGMTAEETFSIPGILTTGGPGLPDVSASLPDGSYIILSAQISCTPCGWALLIGVCAFCVATSQFSSDGFTALIPFAGAESPGGCPEAGPVTLECFGLQFGIPCSTTTTATIE